MSRLLLRRLIHCYNKRTSLIMVVCAPVVLLLVAGGVYAALGGVIRPQVVTDIELQRGLVGHWKLDGNTKDSTPYANNGVATAEATVTSDRKSKEGSAYNFTGSGSYISVPDSDILSQTTITVSAWVYPAGTSGSRNIVSKNGNAEYRYRINSGSNTVTVFDRGATNTITTTDAVPANQWSLVSFTADESGIKIYINDSLSSSGGGAFAPPNSTGPLYIGAYAGSSENFIGKIDDVRLYNRGLSDAEIKALYEQYDTSAKVLSGEKGLVGRFRLDGDVKDSSPYGADCTNLNAIPATDRKGKVSGAYSFNGSDAAISCGHLSQFQFSDDFTISAWVYGTNWSNNAQGGIVQYGAGGYWFRMTPAGVLQPLYYNATGTQSYACASPTALDLNTWYHVATSFSSGVINVYINGQVVNTCTAPFLSVGSYSNGFFIGSVKNFSGRYFTGSIDDVRLYARVLDQGELEKQYESYDSQLNLYANPSTSSGSNIHSGLAGYWPFNGNARDATPHANNGSGVNSPSLTTDRKGRASSAYSFDGGQHIVVPNGPSLNLSGDLSVSTWVKPGISAQANFARIACKYDGSKINYLLAYDSGSPGRMRFIVDTSSTRIIAYSTTMITDTTKWYHLVGVRSGNSVLIYVDGALQGTASISGSSSLSSSSLILGGSCNGASYNGAIDDVRIYGRALSVGEVTALHGKYY